MDDRVKKWLFDVQKAILEIEFFLEGRERVFSVYQKDLLLKRAIERELEIIGEAMNRISKVDEKLTDQIADARNIIGLRNQVIHAYDNISDENIWAIVINHLPTLKADVMKLLNS